MAITVQRNIITNINQLNVEAYYTYTDYLTWQFDEMVELIRGKLFKMSPAPNLHHQDVAGVIFGEWYKYFENKECRLYIAPFDVRFPAKKGLETDTVVQPDLCVVCDVKKLDKKGCNGIPDLVVEILSPGNTAKEMNQKFNLYESEGVREYWLVHPEEKWLIIYNLNEEHKYTGGKPLTSEDGKINSIIFPDLILDLNKVFDLLELKD